MPELPEVETVRRGLAPVLERATIREATARRANLRFPIPDDFAARLTGNQILGLRRRSKYILMDCADGLVVIMHLGMSGKVTIYKDGETPEIGKHDHISLITEAGDHVVYTDPRRFGIWTFSDTDTCDSHPLIINIGPEPLGNSFNEQVLKSGFKNKKSPIKNALLDQRIVAGLGNIYVCEALWRAGINPTKHAGKISSATITGLVPIIRDILTEAIAAGGSSLKDFAQADGELGYFQHNFRAYGREGEACLKEDCGGTIQRIVQSGRSTFYCARCQR